MAQLYHFDMDRPQFLKLFFYLTDVTPDTGPHCYVRASHRERPAALWRDGRHADDEVLALYGRASEVEITAPRGTLIAVDTSGFRKGKPLIRGAACSYSWNTPARYSAKSTRICACREASSGRRNFRLIRSFWHAFPWRERVRRHAWLAVRRGLP